MSFYVAPAAPYLPSQWPLPMPVPYNPCVAFPGMGFSIAVPPFPPTAYMETPGFIMLPSHLPLGDHRAPNPQYLAAQRFRRHVSSFQKETVSMGVQTEPSSLDRSNPRFSRRIECAGLDSGRGTACSGSTSASSPTSGVCLQVKNVTPDVNGALGSNCVVGMGNGWRPCCTRSDELPAGELCGGGNSEEHAASSTKGLVPMLASSAHEADLCAGVGKQGDQQCASCPCVQLEGVSPLPSIHTLPNRDCGGCKESASAQQDQEASQGVDHAEDARFKIIKLPFSIQYIVDWKKMANQSVWSVESLALYIPSAEWVAQHGQLVPEEGSNIMTDSCSESQEATSLGSEGPSKGQRESVSSVDSLPPCIPASSWLAEVGKITRIGTLPSALQEQECSADIWESRRQDLGCKNFTSCRDLKCRCGKKLKWESGCQYPTCTQAVMDKGGIKLLNGKNLHFWVCKNSDAAQRQLIQPSAGGAASQASKGCMRGIPSLDVALLHQEVNGSAGTGGQHQDEVLMSQKEC